MSNCINNSERITEQLNAERKRYMDKMKGYKVNHRDVGKHWGSNKFAGKLARKK